MVNKFLNLDYLKNGNMRQKQAYNILKESRIFTHLKAYNPLLAGTVPIGIDIAGSDLDIVCCFEDREKFVDEITLLLKLRPGFCLNKDERQGAVVCRFEEGGMVLEIFASRTDSEKSNAFRHMLIENRILDLAGREFRKKVVALKKQGMKTEPAFAKLLGLKGEPYLALLELEGVSDEVLINLSEKTHQTDK